MVFQDDKDILAAIDSPVSGKLLAFARERSSLLVKYLTGEGLIEHMRQIPHLCNENAFEAMKIVARTTRAEFERIKKPAKKVYTAKGGVRILYLNTDSETDRVTAILDDVTKGMSIKDWVKSIAEPARDTDPMSLTFTELDGEGNAYPTYKSTEDIHDYLLDGRKPEYVIFKVSDEDRDRLHKEGKISDEAIKKKKGIYRVVDDAFFRVVSVANTQITTEYEYPNFWGYVPAKISGDIPNFATGYYESPYEAILDLLIEYFQDNTSKSLYKKYQMHPKEWTVLSDCPKCDGEKVLNGEDCRNCGGTGKTAGSGIAQVLGIEVNDEGKAAIPTPPFGFASPGTESLEFATSELERLFNWAYEIIWDTQRIGKAQGTDGNSEILTATGELIRERGKEPALREFSGWAETLDAFHSTNIKRVAVRNPKSDEVTVTYGRRYSIGKPEELMLIYADAKAKRMPVPVLNDLYMEIIEARYETSPIELGAQKNIFAVEPFPHNSIEEVSAWGVDGKLLLKKIYFPMWLNSITDLQAYLATEEQLATSLEDYANKFTISAPSEEEELTA